MRAVYNELNSKDMEDKDYEMAAKAGWSGDHPESAASLSLLAGNQKT